jgi:hypothetical protein
MADTSMKPHGSVTLPALREIVTWPSSNGWRMTSRAERLNSGQFVEKQHPVVGQRDLAGTGDGAAAEQADVGNCMVR